MQKIRISYKNKYFADVESLYVEAFPADERRDIEAFRQIAACNPAFAVDVFVGDNEEFLGFFTTWTWDDLRYGEHFAVRQDRRGGGIGSKALQAVIADDPRPLILEVELPDNDMARRRIGFYERNGLRLWDAIPYVQPPYDAERNALPMLLMTAGDIQLSPDDPRVERLLRDVYGFEK